MTLIIQKIDQTVLEEHPHFNGHYNAFRCTNPETGLKAVITLGNTARSRRGLAPIRIRDIDDDTAFSESLLVSNALTEKCALAGLDGFGFSVIIQGDPEDVKTPEVITGLNEALNRLKHVYYDAERPFIPITGLDAGFTEDDHDWAEGLLDSYPIGAQHGLATAQGLYFALQAALQFKEDIRSLSGIKVAVQGAGKVGRPWCEILHKFGAELIVYDHNHENAQWVRDKLGATIVNSNEELLDTDVDVFSPCGRGPVFSSTEDATLLHSRYILGSTNGQLANNACEEIAQTLQERGVLYVPDTLVNVGGVIASLYTPERVHGRLELIGDKTWAVLRDAETSGLTPLEISRNLIDGAFAKTIHNSRNHPSPEIL